MLAASVAYLAWASALADHSTNNSLVSRVYIVFSTHLDLGYAQPCWDPAKNKTNTCGAKAVDVINRHFDEHFAAAADTASQMRNTSRNYSWMTQPWLVSLFRNCAGAESLGIHCPNATQLQAFEAAVQGGALTWGAFPFNAEPELFDASLFQSGLALAAAETNATTLLHGGRGASPPARGSMTPRMTMSQRDVPGLTRAAVPLLAAAGVRAVAIGENNAQSPIDVPPLFLWHDPSSDTEVLALYHSGGYGGDEPAPTPAPSNYVCSYATGAGVCVTNPNAWATKAQCEKLCDKSSSTPSPDTTTIRLERALVTVPPADSHESQLWRWGVTQQVDCVTVVLPPSSSGADSEGVALCYAWRSDNTGPHRPAEVTAVFDAVQELYPNATARASDAIDDFVAEVWSVRHKLGLQVVEAEIGDPWIYGASADPAKVARFRAISRARTQCFAMAAAVAPTATASAAAAKSRAGLQGSVDVNCAGTTHAELVELLRPFDRWLMTAGEHTWGTDGGDMRVNSWSNYEMKLALADPHELDLHLAVESWSEQRAFLDHALELIGVHPNGTKKQECGRSGGGGRLSQLVSDELQALLPVSCPALSDDPAEAVPGFEPVPQAHWFQEFDGGHCAVDRYGEHSNGGGGIRIAFASDGSIRLLVGPSGRVWANSSDPQPIPPLYDQPYPPAGDGGGYLGRLWYQGLNRTFFNDFVYDYSAGATPNAWNFGKPGMDLPAHSGSPVLQQLWVQSSGGGGAASSVGSDVTRFVLHLELPTELHEEKGAPAQFRVLVEVPCAVAGGGELRVNYTVLWVNKTATHLPETIWLMNAPRLQRQRQAARGSDNPGADEEWFLDKMGVLVGASEADLNPTPGGHTCAHPNRACGAHLHAVLSGAYLGVQLGDGLNHSFAVLASDSALVSVGEDPGPVPVPMAPPNASAGVHFSLVGNAWNTNYPFFYPFESADATAKFRFAFLVT
jgi:hypothetical protein